MPSSTRIVLEVQGRIDTLRLIWEVLEQVMGDIPEARHQEEERFTTLVAVQEAVTNVLRHAYQGRLDRPLRVEIEREDSRLVVITQDDAPPFETPTYVVLPDEGEDGDLAEGGYGLFIMRHVMTEVRYERVGRFNRLYLVKDFCGVPVASLAGGEV